MRAQSLYNIPHKTDKLISFLFISSIYAIRKSIIDTYFNYPGFSGMEKSWTRIIIEPMKRPDFQALISFVSDWLSAYITVSKIDTYDLLTPIAYMGVTMLPCSINAL